MNIRLYISSGRSLSYFKLIVIFYSKEKMRRGVRRGCVRLRGAVVGIDDEDDSTFTVTVDNKTFHFQVVDQDVFLHTIVVFIL